MKGYKLLLIILFIIIFVVGSVITVKSISFIEIVNTELSTYLIKKEVKYEVHLFKNTAIDEQVLEMNKTYIAKLVDKIKFNYSFIYSGNSELEYSLSAYFTAEYKNTNVVSNPIIMTKEYPIIPVTKVTKYGNEPVGIDKEIEFDYIYYNQELHRIQQVISVPVKAYVDLIFKIKDNMNGKTYNSTYSIPVGQEVFGITNKTSMKNEENSTTEIKIDQIPCIIGVAMMLISIVAIYKIIKKTGKRENRESHYTVKLNRILQNYGDIVVEMVEPIELEDFQVRNVKNFEQLVDIEVEIRKPIVFYETIPKREGEFIIIQDDIAYRYVLKNIKSNYKYKRKI